MLEPAQCKTCEHFKNKIIANGRYGCDAFPNGIPDDIYAGVFWHGAPHSGDHNLQYVEMITKHKSSFHMNDRGEINDDR